MMLAKLVVIISQYIYILKYVVDLKWVQQWWFSHCVWLLWPHDCSSPGSSVEQNTRVGCYFLPSKNTGVGCYFLLQGIFPTQELKPGLLHCRQILYQLSYKGIPDDYNITYQLYLNETGNYWKSSQHLRSISKRKHFIMCAFE